MDRNPIVAEAITRITNSLLMEQDDEQFCMLLEKYGLADLIPTSAPYLFDTQKNGKILLLGDSSVRPKEFEGILKEFNISKDRLKYVQYSEITNFKFKELEYNSNYRLILVGPVPHKARDIEGENSLTELIFKNKSIAKAVGLDNFKITKTSFKSAIKKEVDSGYLLQDL